MSFEMLPDEMLLEICRYLHSGDVLYSFFGLNSRLNQTITFYRQHVSLHRTTYMQFVHIFNFILPKMSSSIRSLVIFELESPSFLTAFQNRHLCENLEKLKLVNWTDEKLMRFVDTLHGMERFRELIIQALDLTETSNHRPLLQKLLGANENRLTYMAFDHECDAVCLTDDVEQHIGFFPNIIQLDVELQTTKDLFQFCTMIPNVERLRVTFKRPWSDLPDHPPKFLHLRELSVYAMSYFSTVNDFSALIGISSVLENVSLVLVSHDKALIDGERILSLLPSSIKTFDYSICYQPLNLEENFDPSRIVQSWKSLPIAYSICPEDKRIFLHTISYRSNRLSLRSLFHKNMSTKSDTQIYHNVRHIHVYDTLALAEIFGIVQHCRQVLDLVVSMRTLPARIHEPIRTVLTLPLLTRLDFLSIQGSPPDGHYIERILSVAPNLSALSMDFDCLHKLLLDDDQSLLLYYLLARRIVILCIRFENSPLMKLTSEHVHCIARIFPRVNHICFDLRTSNIPIDLPTIALILNHFPNLIVLSMYGSLSEEMTRNRDVLGEQLVEQSTGRLKCRENFRVDYGNERVKVWM